MYRLQYFDSGECRDVPAGNKTQARAAIRKMFPNAAVKFSKDRVYVGRERMFYYRAKILPSSGIALDPTPLDSFLF